MGEFVFIDINKERRIDGESQGVERPQDTVNPARSVSNLKGGKDEYQCFCKTN